MRLLCVSIRAPSTPWSQFCACLSIVCPFCISCRPQLDSVEQGRERNLTPINHTIYSIQLACLTHSVNYQFYFVPLKKFINSPFFPNPQIHLPNIFRLVFTKPKFNWVLQHNYKFLFFETLISPFTYRKYLKFLSLAVLYGHDPDPPYLIPITFIFIRPSIPIKRMTCFQICLMLAHLRLCSYGLPVGSSSDLASAYTMLMYSRPSFPFETF
jgi:hypothetical protein